METQQDWKHAFQKGKMKSIKNLKFIKLTYSPIPMTTYLIPSTPTTWILPITEPGLSAPYQPCEPRSVFTG